MGFTRQGHAYSMWGHGLTWVCTGREVWEWASGVMTNVAHKSAAVPHIFYVISLCLSPWPVSWACMQSQSQAKTSNKLESGKCLFFLFWNMFCNTDCLPCQGHKHNIFLVHRSQEKSVENCLVLSRKIFQ